MRKWIIILQDDSLHLGESKTKPVRSDYKEVISCPEEVRSIEEINVLDVADEFGELQKVVSIDAGKVAAYEAKLADQLVDKEARAAARQAKIDKIKGMKSGDLNNIAEVKQAIEDILAYLGLE